ncbi:MAG: metalloregulator ArsR/SmtB family transcription factor [Planctomycetes bacterium]|nr:metalloregulator ArsR/SmtB family transcription factor [Planctomycetota bacterium]
METNGGLRTVPDDLCRVVCFNRRKIAALRKRLPDAGDVEQTSSIHKVLGHPGRLAVLSLLAIEECCVCDVANVLGLPLSTASQHLRALRTVNLIKPRQDGKLVFYSVTGPAALRFVAAMDEVAG